MYIYIQGNRHFYFTTGDYWRILEITHRENSTCISNTVTHSSISIWT